MKPFRQRPKQCRSIPVIGQVAVVTGASSGIGARDRALPRREHAHRGGARQKSRQAKQSGGQCRGCGLGAAGVLVGSAVLATLMPAAKASRLDVLQALRSE